MKGKKIDELQFSCMVAAVGVDEIQRLLDKYDQDAKTMVTQLREGILSGDIATCNRLIHALKGVSSNFGFSSVNYSLDQLRKITSRVDADISSLEFEIEGSIRKAEEIVFSFK